MGRAPAQQRVQQASYLDHVYFSFLADFFNKKDEKTEINSEK
jgi:hypothetical protein